MNAPALSPIRERAIAFACSGDSLVGIVAEPRNGPAADTALVIVVGGPQVRCGSHRQFTQLARAAAAAGFPALRFDVRGMGDAEGEQRTFEQLDDDIAAAVGALQAACPGVRRVALWGLCDGASASLMYTHSMQDARVAGLVLANPWVRSAETLARAHLKHYYWNRLRQLSFWRKLLGGGVALQALRGLVHNLRTARGVRPQRPGAGDVRRAPTALPFPQRMLAAAEAFGGPVLWILSGRDYTAKEFIEATAARPRWQAVLCQATSARLHLAAADHTFSGGEDEARVGEATVDWLRRHLAAAGA
jgi:exosortase A-associated hydrolase 1